MAVLAFCPLFLHATPIADAAPLSSLDDTYTFIHLAPDTSSVVAGGPSFPVHLVGTFDDARVYGARIGFDPDLIQVLSLLPSGNPGFFLLPLHTSGDTLCIDGYFHPNFTGTDTVGTLMLKALSHYPTETGIAFIAGQGWSGTTDEPIPMSVSGDTAVIVVTGVAQAIRVRPLSLQTVNGCASFRVHLIADFVDARVFELVFRFDHGNYDLISFAPGSNPDLHLLPHELQADRFRLDGHYHPNYTGTDTLGILELAATSSQDTATVFGFLSGEGYCGLSDSALPMLLTGDSARIDIEATAPLPPAQLVIQRLPMPAHDDSVKLMWRPVRYDTDGDTVIQPLYKVYFVDIVLDSTFLAAQTHDTFLYSAMIDSGARKVFYDSLGIPVDTTDNGMYFIRTCKTQP